MTVRRVCLLVIGILLFSCLCLGTAFRKNGIIEADMDLVTPDGDQGVFFEYYELFPEEGIDTAVPLLDSLWDESTLIVTGTPVKSVPVYKCLLTEVSVHRTIKGECPDTISVFESAGLNYITDENSSFDNIFYAYDGYVLMEQGKEYILFLSNEGKEYRVTKQGFGKYPLKKEPVVYILNGAEALCYREYLTYDVLCDNENSAEVYLANAREIRQLIMEQTN